MGLLEPTQFVNALSDMYADQKGSVTVRAKKILSRKVAQPFRSAAMATGEYVMLYRAYRGNNAHKRKISVAITLANHAEFQASLAHVLDTHVAPQLKNTSRGRGRLARVGNHPALPQTTIDLDENETRTRAQR